ncbi:PEP-CTERM sorting domain-containing protein [Psychromonas sp. SP041]|uniref:PEP-CTERM sorting domain-containing protein n=1 Tax=Psychromonas sp. SP041 TaxID=1365007 RepID=UPI0003F8250A|nr:PEP-CTERM sorting domain-containing protein [Psychromonas sp. SP041]
MDIFKFSTIKKIGLALGLLFSTNSFAGTIVDVVYQDQALSGFGNSISYQHDITDDGFTFGSATSANLAIQVNNLSFWETLLFQIDEFDFDSGAITLGSGYINNLEVNALAALNSDGLLDVFVYAGPWTSVRVGTSTLTVQVPEPSTILILGLAIIGLSLRRQRKL